MGTPFTSNTTLSSLVKTSNLSTSLPRIDSLNIVLWGWLALCSPEGQISFTAAKSGRYHNLLAFWWGLLLRYR